MDTAKHELNHQLLQMMSNTSKEKICVNALKSLISAGADVNTRDLNGNFPLILASGNGLTHIVTELLSVPGILVNQSDQVNKDGQTALMKAVDLPVDNSAASVSALLSHSCILVNQQNIFGHTALMQAIFFHNTPAVVALLKAPGLMINLKNQKGESAISIALNTGQNDIVKILKKNRATLPEEFIQPVEDASWIDKIKNLFNHKLNFEVPNLDPILNHSAGAPSSLTFSYNALNAFNGLNRLEERERKKYKVVA
jgi:ankyrin repeat protein